MSPRGRRKTGLYDTLPPELQDAFRRARSDLDLSDEIRLLRVVLYSLADGLPDTAHAMKEVASVLARMAYVQSRQLGGTSDAEQALVDAADLALNRLALEEVPNDR